MNHGTITIFKWWILHYGILSYDNMNDGIIRLSIKLLWFCGSLDNDDVGIMYTTVYRLSVDKTIGFGNTTKYIWHLYYFSVRAKSHLRDSITQTWYYHVCVIHSITQTWYIISGKFLTLKKMSARCALFRTLLIHTFLQQCVILKIVFSLKY